MDNVDLTAYSKEDLEKARHYPKVIAVLRILCVLGLLGPDPVPKFICTDPDPYINSKK